VSQYLPHDVRIAVQQSPWSRKVQVQIGMNADPNFSVATNITFERVEPGVAMGPTLELEREAAQSLFQQLWDIGLRPNQGHGMPAQVESLQNHLEDMRTIAFAAIGEAKPTLKHPK